MRLSYCKEKQKIVFLRIFLVGRRTPYYSTIGDMFPKSTVATITGIGGLAAGTSSFLINKGAGMLFTYSENAGAAYSFLGFEGKEAGYMTVFCICAVAYLIAWTFMKVLVPVYKKIEA